MPAVEVNWSTDDSGPAATVELRSAAAYANNTARVAAVAAAELTHAMKMAYESGLTLRQIADIAQISPERVRQRITP